MEIQNQEKNEKFDKLLQEIWDGSISKDDIKNRLNSNEFGLFEVYAAKAYSGDTKVLSKIFDYLKMGENQPEKEDSESSSPAYRELSTEEQKIMFGLYDKHSGNLTALSNDPESLFHSRPQLVHYKYRYGWRNTFERIRTQRVFEFRKKMRKKLEDAKLDALMQAIKLLSPREIEIVLKGGVLASIEQEPHYKEIKTAWEIIKTELGEPTTISKNENTNINDAVEAESKKLNNFLRDVQTAAATDAEGNQEDEPISC